MENNHEVINNENDVQVKMPYNLREKKIKSAPYRDLIRTELADELYDRIYELVVTQKSTSSLTSQPAIWLRY